MTIYTSYGAAFHACMKTETFALAHLTSLKKNVNIDTSGCDKVFFLLSGKKKFNINDRIYNTNPNELYVIGPDEWHYFSEFSEEDDHERFVFFIYPEYLRQLSSQDTKLEACFFGKEEASHRISLSAEEKVRFIYFMTEFAAAERYGSDLMESALFLEMVISVNRLHQLKSSAAPFDTISAYSQKSDELLSYIEAHLTENLSVQLLAKQFFFSPSYLCKFFKKATGTTIHKYVTARRITLAKTFLTEGYPITEVGEMSGFQGYNAFLRAFTSCVGMSPKKYAQIQSDGD